MSQPAPLVALVTGELVPSDSPAWRLETEARMLLGFDWSKREAWLGDLEARRGRPGTDALRDAIALIQDHGRAR